MYNKEHKTYHMHHRTEIKTVRGKTGFWNLFENWSLRDLKIGFLEIKCKNENLEIKFERNWDFENYLRVWDLKKLNYENWDFGN